MYAKADLPVLHSMAPANSSNPLFDRWVLRVATEATATAKRRYKLTLSGSLHPAASLSSVPLLLL